MENIKKVFLSVEEFALTIGCSKYLAYEAVRQKKIRFIKFGRRIYIPRKEVDRLSNVGIGEEDTGVIDHLDCV